MSIDKVIVIRLVSSVTNQRLAITADPLGIKKPAYVSSFRVVCGIPEPQPRTYEYMPYYNRRSLT